MTGIIDWSPEYSQNGYKHVRNTANGFARPLKPGVRELFGRACVFIYSSERSSAGGRYVQ
jgi:hypothetical protein